VVTMIWMMRTMGSSSRSRLKIASLLLSLDSRYNSFPACRRGPLLLTTRSTTEHAFMSSSVFWTSMSRYTCSAMASLIVKNVPVVSTQAEEELSHLEAAGCLRRWSASSTSTPQCCCICAMASLAVVAGPLAPLLAALLLLLVQAARAFVADAKPLREASTSARQRMNSSLPSRTTLPNMGA